MEYLYYFVITFLKINKVFCSDNSNESKNKNEKDIKTPSEKNDESDNFSDDSDDGGFGDFEGGPGLPPRGKNYLTEFFKFCIVILKIIRRIVNALIEVLDRLIN